jgi:hypothetical protein
MHVFHRRKEEYMGFVVLHGKGARDERQTATLVKGKPLKYAGNSTRRSTDGNARPKRQGFKC